MNSTNKTSICENDVILIYIENKPTFFARIEEITPDIKKGWWRVKLLILQIPLAVTTWILDNDQIRGADFTMGGTPLRIEKIVAPPEVINNKEQEKEELSDQTAEKKQARIISLTSNNKK